jgi:CspA family cold shock protein
MTQTGTIIRIVSDKGFGFVEGTDGTEYFFHRTAVAGEDFAQLRQGDRVAFIPGEGAKGPRTEHVTRA